MFLALIPARGGSRRIPHKNIRPFLGKPMIVWSIEAAQRSGCFTRIVVSTDDAEIAAIAREAGAEVPFLRPAALADTHTPTVPVVAHALEALAKDAAAPAQEFSAVCCLYATAPLVNAADLCAGLRLLEESGDSCDYVFPICAFRAPIQRALLRDADGRVRMAQPEYADTRSQDLPRCYHDAGQFYWGRPAAWRAGRSIFSPRARTLLLPHDRVQDIDTPEDWAHAEHLARLVTEDSTVGR